MFFAKIYSLLWASLFFKLNHEHLVQQTKIAF